MSKNGHALLRFFLIERISKDMSKMDIFSLGCCLVGLKVYFKKPLVLRESRISLAAIFVFFFSLGCCLVGLNKNPLVLRESRISLAAIFVFFWGRDFGSFGLSTKESYTIMLYVSLMLLAFLVSASASLVSVHTSPGHKIKHRSNIFGTHTSPRYAH